MMNEEKNQLEQDTLGETELDEVNGGLIATSVLEEIELKKVEQRRKAEKAKAEAQGGLNNPTLTPGLKIRGL